MCKRFYMKNISEMTIKEIEDEIKMAKFDANENYVFVSYSHMDYKQVYPMVLRWIRKGYNIYLDVDFENHSGNENWVEMMTKALRSASCQLVACSTARITASVIHLCLNCLRFAQMKRQRKENRLQILFYR